MLNPSLKPSAPTKAPKKDIKDMDALYNIKIIIESNNWEHGCIRDQ